MKGDAWETGHRMPFVVRWPGAVKPGSVTDQTICFTDMLSTFAAITGAPAPAGAGPDSFSILPVLQGKQPNGKAIRGPLAIASSRGAMTIRDGKWKLITALGSGGFSEPRKVKPTKGGPKGQLYDMENDRGETTNLYLKHPGVVARLSAELKRIRDADQTRP
jgi:arylsulfatase A-like enzyme